jgi:REP element-mobilizing transposase RayT
MCAMISVPMKHENFNDDHTPLGYLITFRSYGTWLHGDVRGSVDRHHRRFGSSKLSSSTSRKQIEQNLLTQPQVKLNSRQRTSIDLSIRETCSIRKWKLWALNIRSNHLHCVVSANRKPGTVLSALKANATRSMREAGCWRGDLSPWAQGGSKKYLWTEGELTNAIAYVVEDQGEPLE